MKKRKIIISIFLMISIIIVTILFIKTDLFKTKEMLFWKYMISQKDEIAQVLSNDTIKKYNDTFEKSSYIKEGNISIKSKNNLINPINIQIEEKGNNLEESINTNLTLKYDEKDIGSLSIIKDDNYFLLKSDLIDSKYIGFENENLKELAKKFGLANTDFIPDKIEPIDYYELFSITDSEKNYIMKKYIPICRKIVKNKNYYIEENVEIDNENNNVTSYKIEISEEEANELIIEVLAYLSEDNITLEFICKKIKVLNSGSEYCDINKLKEKVNELARHFKQKEAEDKTFLSIIIYKKENNVIKTEIVLENDRTISVENVNGENKILIKQYDVNNKQIKVDSIDGIITTILNAITEITYSRDIINNETNKVDINIICNLGIENITLNINYVEQIKNDVENIIHKNDVDYIDLKNFTEEMYKSFLEKVLKIEGLKVGKKS